MNKTTFSFQVDSDIISNQRRKPNYHIEYSPHSQNNICVLYFSSNDIYFPNTKSAFEFSIIEKDRYEWRNLRVNYAYKHIFIRDIYKQWYLQGINNEINSPQKLYEWLKEETKGYEIETIGSSAGGYAAILYGLLLNATKILAFNPQFELDSLLETSEDKNPLIFRLRQSELHKYYDLLPFIQETQNQNIFYFVSEDSLWDQKQLLHLNNISINTINIIRFNNYLHGIPFPKVALPKVLNMNVKELTPFVGKVHSPILFSIKVVGLIKTLQGLAKQTLTLCRKLIQRKLIK